MSGRRVQPPPKHSAAYSHLANDRYMDDFEKAWEQMRALTMDPDSPYYNPAAASEGRGPGGASASRPPPPAPRPGPQRLTRPAAGRGATGGLPDRYPSMVTSGWHLGPVDMAGIMCDVSDRPNMCSAAHWPRGELVVGSSDHALYVIDANKGDRKRTLYTKQCGHTEWVTTCCFLPSGQVVSGAMDSKLWVWPAGGVRGTEMDGHFGPISKVAYDPASGMVASASYDKTVRLWDVGGGYGREAVRMEGHGAPVLEMVPSPDGFIISGDRSGHIILWDTGTGAEVWQMKRVHAGHITALAWFNYEDDSCAGCFASGGQDGCLRVWDPRERACPAKVELHVNEVGRGALGDICAGGRAAGGMVVTAGADGTLCIVDPRKGFALMHQIQLSNFPYSMAVAGGLALVGCGDGSLWVVHIATGEVKYCLGANRHAVRCIEACEDRLMASGDDGKVLLWHFS